MTTPTHPFPRSRATQPWSCGGMGYRRLVACFRSWRWAAEACLLRCTGFSWLWHGFERERSPGSVYTHTSFWLCFPCGQIDLCFGLLLSLLPEVPNPCSRDWFRPTRALSVLVTENVVPTLLLLPGYILFLGLLSGPSSCSFCLHGSSLPPLYPVFHSEVSIWSPSEKPTTGLNAGNK